VKAKVKVWAVELVALVLSAVRAVHLQEVHLHRIVLVAHRQVVLVDRRPEARHMVND
jgi:hypothetical protein